MESARETGGGAGSARPRHDQQLDSETENGEAGSSRLGETASAAARQAKKAASSIAHDANDKIQEVLDVQVQKGADLIDNVAASIRSAANDLDRSSPHLADLARGAADLVGNFSGTVRDQSAGELIRSGADFARRQPAILFGAATLLGFGLYRLFSVSMDDRSVQIRSRSGVSGRSAGAARKSGGRNGARRITGGRSQGAESDGL
jgi:hypothetical protein